MGTLVGECKYGEECEGKGYDGGAELAWGRWWRCWDIMGERVVADVVCEIGKRVMPAKSSNALDGRNESVGRAVVGMVLISHAIARRNFIVPRLR
jgi:hypothetical protein